MLRIMPFAAARAPHIQRLCAGALALTVGVAGVTAVAWAMRVSPMVSELTTTGAGSTARIEVGNVGAAALPFETLLTRMELDADGNIVETPADEEFLVFPPQGLVPVGGRQVVRVQWVGPTSLPASQAFYLWVRQLPVDLETTESQTGGSASIQVLYTMKSLIVVAPPGAEPKVDVVSITPTMVKPPAPEIDADLGTVEAAVEVPGVEIVVENTGRRYALMSGANWVLEGTDVNGQIFARQFTGDEISETVGVGYLPPLGGRRTFRLPTDVALDPTKPSRLRFTR